MGAKPSHPVSKRLEDLRKRGRLSLAELRRRVIAAGYQVSYPSVQNYHHDREPPLGYLVAVGRVFQVSPAALAFGPIEAPAQAKRHAGISLPEPLTDENAVLREAEIRFLSFESRFYAHLWAGKATLKQLNDIFEELWDRLPVGWDEDGLVDPRDRFDRPEAHDLTMTWLRALDSMLADAWRGREELLAAGNPAAPQATRDERLRFRRGFESALLASLPDSGRPDLPHPTRVGRLR